MKRKLFIAAIISACLLSGTLVIARLTGILGFFSVPSESNAPTYMPGDYFLTLSFKKPKRGDFIIFPKDDPQFGPSVWKHRLVGMPGDVLQIVDGILMLNGVNADKDINLMQEYLVTNKEDAASIIENTGLNHNGDQYGDTMRLFAAVKFVREKHIPAERFLHPKSFTDSFIYRQWTKPWNVDQFGPVRVPAGQYFVLGDNRHNAMDSRYIGYIAADKVLGTVFVKL